jgi:hypothetical protein
MKILKYLFAAILIFSVTIPASAQAQAQEVVINNFIVKENLLKNDKLAIISANGDEKPIEGVNGTFLFSINGFKQELRFNDGVAVAPVQIDKSTFVYIKHTNDAGTHAKLYYVVKKDDNLNPIKINWLVLLLVPLALIILTMMFRKFLIIAGVLIIALLIFNHNQGLGISTFFETVFDGLKSMF